MISLCFVDVFAILENRVLGDFEAALAPKVKLSRHKGAREEKVMFPGNNLILAGVLKQKLARRTKRPESAKLSDRMGRAKVGKT